MIEILIGLLFIIMIFIIVDSCIQDKHLKDIFKEYDEDEDDNDITDIKFTR